MNPSLTVLMPTYNRAEGLRKTLSAMCRMDLGALDVDFLVIDNNSTDHTRQVVESFIGALPVRYRFELRKGKSCALNGALDDERLGEIVVFVDDDISPVCNWLQEITRSVREWPDYSLFGGRVISQWPDGSPPPWWDLATRDGQKWTLGGHHLSEETGPYPPRGRPSGPNTWLRRSILDTGIRYDESIGPLGKATVMGEDGIFVQKLIDQGHAALYCPKAAVEHRIQRELTTAKGIRRRAWSQGKGIPHYNGLCMRELFERRPTLWKARRLAALGWALAKLFYALSSVKANKRIANSLAPICDIACNLEYLRTTSVR